MEKKSPIRAQKEILDTHRTNERGIIGSSSSLLGWEKNENG